MARSIASAFVVGALLGPLFVPSTSQAQEAPHDPWFGRDKALHFGASAALAAGGYAASAIVFEAPAARLVSGAGVALTAGVAKELDDLSGEGDASWRDLTWDVVGTGVGLLAAWLVDRFVVTPHASTTTAARERSAIVGAGPRSVGLMVRF